MAEVWCSRAVSGDYIGISKKFNISTVTAQILLNRGLVSYDDIETFFNAEKNDLAPPELMKNLKEACGVIKEKIRENKKIRIIGDYDVDGVCSTYILYDFFKSMGADISYDIPHRVHDGYGINIRLIKKAKNDGIDTIITCDNGIAAYEEVKYAKDIGLTVIITDHHDIPVNQPLPPADTVTDPKREDCQYPFDGLCGAGVVYRLISYYAQVYSQPKITKKEIEEQYLAITALATICDVMELIKENRTIVKKGLVAIKNTKNIGLRAMLNVSELCDKEKITVYHCGFVIGPMINAAGRLGSAMKPIELLLEKDEKKAIAEAEELKKINENRKSITETSFDIAVEIAESDEYINDTVLVLLLPDCHESIAGIVAGRIKEKFYKPTLILTKAETGIKGSGRSIEAYDMFNELSKCAECFSKFGGHTMAAGFSIKGETKDEQLENLQKLRNKLNKLSSLTNEDLKPVVYFDMELSPALVTEGLIDELALLEPYGTGNRPPVFAQKNMHIHSFRVLGKNENAVKLELTEGTSGRIYTAIWFGAAREFENYIISKQEKRLDIIYSAEINEYNGKRNIQFRVIKYI